MHSLWKSLNGNGSRHAFGRRPHQSIEHQLRNRVVRFYFDNRIADWTVRMLPSERFFRVSNSVSNLSTCPSCPSLPCLAMARSFVERSSEHARPQFGSLVGPAWKAARIDRVRSVLLEPRTMLWMINSMCRAWRCLLCSPMVCTHVRANIG